MSCQVAYCQIEKYDKILHFLHNIVMLLKDRYLYYICSFVLCIKSYSFVWLLFCFINTNFCFVCIDETVDMLLTYAIYSLVNRLNLLKRRLKMEFELNVTY